MNSRLFNIHLKGYTVHEMIVVLSISSIILIMGLLFYETILKSYSMKITGLDEGLLVSSLYSRLENDLETCTGIRSEENDLVFFIQDDSVHYSFTKSAIIINRECIDTIGLVCKNFQLLRMKRIGINNSTSIVLIFKFSMEDHTEIEIKLFRYLPFLFIKDEQDIQ